MDWRQLQAIEKLQERTSNCSITDILLDQSKFHNIRPINKNLFDQVP